MVLVWYPIGVRNEADAATATAMATPLGSSPTSAAAATAIGGVVGDELGGDDGGDDDSEQYPGRPEPVEGTDKAVRDHLRESRGLHGRRQPERGGDDDHDIDVDGTPGFQGSEHAGQHEHQGPEQRSLQDGQDVERRQRHDGHECDDRDPGPFRGPGRLPVDLGHEEEVGLVAPAFLEAGVADQ